MSVSSVGDILDIGTYLKIFATKGVYSQLPSQSDLWKYIKSKKVAKPEGREVRYAIKTGRGPSASQFLAANEGGSFPRKQQNKIVEAIGYFKEFGTTIGVPMNLLNKTGSELAQYAMPLADELEEKGIGTARMLSRSLLGDGTGALGVVSSVSVSSSKLSVVLNATSAAAGRSHVGNFQMDELVRFGEVDGSYSNKINNNADTVYYWKVTGINIVTDTLTLTPYDVNDAVITVTAVTHANDPGASDLIYPIGDLSLSMTFPDVTSNTTVGDYAKASLAMAGLESLIANDGRTVAGLVMDGTLAGSQLDASGATIDRSHFQSLLSQIKNRVGKNEYKYASALMYSTTYDAMLESWETDRQISSIKDTDRGSSALGYQHGKDNLKFDTDEFISKQRIYILPEGDVIHYRGTDIEKVTVGGVSEFMPAGTNGSHKREILSYLSGSGFLFNTYPAACGIIKNFAV